jgi:hypothetical protein
MSRGDEKEVCITLEIFISVVLYDAVVVLPDDYIDVMDAAAPDPATSREL